MMESHIFQIHQDGSVQVLFNEHRNHPMRFRSVAEIAKSGDSANFRRIATVLKLIAIRTTQNSRSLVPESEINENLHNAILENPGSVNQQVFANRDMIQARFKEPQGKLAELSVPQIDFQYFEMLDSVYLNRPVTESQNLRDVLVSTNLHEAADLKRLYELVKNIPLPVRIQITFHDLLGKGSSFDFDIPLADADISRARVFNHYSMYDTGLRAFQPRLGPFIQLSAVSVPGPEEIKGLTFESAGEGPQESSTEILTDYTGNGSELNADSTNSAMTATGNEMREPATKANGGIDLTPANMHLQTKIDSRFRGNDNRGDGNDREGSGNGNEGIRFHLTPAMLKQLQNAPGFVPVIINIQPMTNLREFLGIN
jgi:hypothetical protein